MSNQATAKALLANIAENLENLKVKCSKLVCEHAVNKIKSQDQQNKFYAEVSSIKYLFVNHLFFCSIGCSFQKRTG
jgi:hypothetical protein|tara:strand:+ start:149 stop:376 length:228 start_codon:yes stop_codon:yes gene_type:complete